MSWQQEELARRRAWAQEVGLFRYALIREAADPALTTKQRGRLVRAIAAREHVGPGGRPVRLTRWTLDRWIAAWRAGGFDALVPAPRRISARTAADTLALAVALKRENPERTAAQVRRILAAQLGAAPALRTLQRHFAEAGLGPGALVTTPAGVFSPFQAEKRNELWTGDGLHGPRVGGRRTFLFAFVDDYSRAAVGYRWSFHEDTVRLADALRVALTARGLPDRAYVDNGAAFVDASLRRACAKLDIRLTHSTPHRPEGRGKIERFFHTVTSQFLVEIAQDTTPEGTGTTVTSLDELNRLFQGWAEQVYHRQTHSETGQPPLARWENAPGTIRHATPAAIAQAFLWSETRVVSRTGLVCLHGNRYQVDAHLAGHRVELVFDPFDLTELTVRLGDTDAGTATPFTLRRHSHPKARPDTPTEKPRPTGINYLALVDAQHTRTLAQKINYLALLDDPTRNDDPASEETDTP
ncbi:DDE-type integrase/transposase/recombinase [Pseudofrankia sp. BMG5.37]|uniref:DDE-type integrase/transposase/recombinase n=1 Tax=Pseudofrankia sp. BMG5.37 TaxID=3050035 RepID=UPI0028956365|nr:DDE-type integrase/transposase/recombinase [Pseudofrankia sp. BMG5.37]MDT3446959.1 DDE-type integrase/transposase/recombinase [Pseudofrankia sp. BMG5.37]